MHSLPSLKPFTTAHYTADYPTHIHVVHRDDTDDGVFDLSSVRQLQAYGLSITSSIAQRVVSMGLLLFDPVGYPNSAAHPRHYNASPGLVVPITGAYPIPNHSPHLPTRPLQDLSRLWVKSHMSSPLVATAARWLTFFHPHALNIKHNTRILTLTSQSYVFALFVSDIGHVLRIRARATRHTLTFRSLSSALICAHACPSVQYVRLIRLAQHAHDAMQTCDTGPCHQPPSVLSVHIRQQLPSHAHRNPLILDTTKTRTRLVLQGSSLQIPDARHIHWSEDVTHDVPVTRDRFIR